jgi:uncharacterized protein (TIGR03663 family)
MRSQFLRIVILLAIATRFYDLGTRVMSHDESLHTYFSWLLYRGQGYEHSPMMHGPFQFTLLRSPIFLFGASDFTSRIPTRVIQHCIVWMVWYWRRYLGKWGALITGFLLVISPYMLYYGRYVRNESFVGFSGVLMLYAILRHLEVGGRKYLSCWPLHLHAALYIKRNILHLHSHEALIFLAIYFIAQVTRRPWKDAENDYRSFIIALGVPYFTRLAPQQAMDFTPVTQPSYRWCRNRIPATQTGELRLLPRPKLPLLLR